MIVLSRFEWFSEYVEWRTDKEHSVYEIVSSKNDETLKFSTDLVGSISASSAHLSAISDIMSFTYTGDKTPEKAFFDNSIKAFIDASTMVDNIFSKSEKNS